MELDPFLDLDVPVRPPANKAASANVQEETASSSNGGKFHDNAAAAVSRVEWTNADAEDPVASLLGDEGGSSSAKSSVPAKTSHASSTKAASANKVSAGKTSHTTPEGEDSLFVGFFPVKGRLATSWCDAMI